MCATFSESYEGMAPSKAADTGELDENLTENPCNGNPQEQPQLLDASGSQGLGWVMGGSGGPSGPWWLYAGKRTPDGLPEITALGPVERLFLAHSGHCRPDRRP